MSVHVIAFTHNGARLGQRIATLHQGSLHVPNRLAQSMKLPAYEGLSDWTGTHWKQGNALIFVGACGIAVRAIAPYVDDKFTDPAVLCVDELGQVVVALLSGHVGGGNQLTCDLARQLDAVAAVSTATDLNNLISIDVWAKERNLTLSSRELAKNVSAQVLEGKQLRIISDVPLTGTPPQGMTEGESALCAYLTVNCQPKDALRLIPKVLHLGIGCRRGKSSDEIEDMVRHVLQEHQLEWCAVKSVASIDLKQDEVGLIAFCKHHQVPFVTYCAQTLLAVEGTFTPSAFVSQITGVDNVCERSACAQGGRLLVSKQACNGITVAVAMEQSSIPYD